MKRALGLLSLLALTFLVSAAAYATSTDTPANLALQNADFSTDLSMQFLNQIFGSVGNVLSGSSGQMLGKMFYIFNAGVLAVAAAWLAYSIGSIVLRSAQEGSFMGQNKNVPVLMLRIALGFALTIPSPGTGYSLSQVAVMQAVVAGVSLANQTWGAVINYLNEGGTLYVVNNKQADSLNDLKPTADALFSASVDGLGMGWQVFMSQVCMARANAYLKEQQQNSGDRGASYQYNMVYDPANATIKFPGKDNTMPLANNARPSCGTVVASGGAFSNPSRAISLDPKQRASEERAFGASYAALTQMAERMWPAAQRFADCKLSSKPYCSNADDEIVIRNALLNGLLGYYSAMDSYAKWKSQAAAGSAKNLQQSLVDNAIGQGWIMAGRYYWDILRINDAYKFWDNQSKVSTFMPTPGFSINDNTFTGGANGATSGDDATTRAAIGNWSDTTNTLSGNLRTVVDGYLTTQNSTGMRSVAGATPNPNVNIAVGGKGKNVAKGVGSAFSTAMNPIGALIDSFKTVEPNPIVFLMNVGRSCLNVAGALYIGGLVSMAIVAVFAGICSSTQPGFLVFNTLYEWIKPILLGLAGALLVPGIVLGYYLPLYPYVLFTFGAVGWFIIVLEAMVAAPLIAFGLTHPEGHDLMGKAEQGLMLLLSVFLRPVLMVIGLVAGMILSYVALKFLLVGFIGILKDLNYVGGTQHGAAGVMVDIFSGAAQVAGQANPNPIVFVVVFTMLLIIFSSIVYKLVQQCYSLVFELPRFVMPPMLKVTAL